MEIAPRTTPGATVTRMNNGWHLQIPAGDRSNYRFAQLDDYATRRRKNFPWVAPTTLSLRARVSSNSIPGTWGFGFWNDPFNAMIGPGGVTRPLPVLPNATWFFHASPENHLSFRDDKSSSGFLTATFQSPKIPSVVLTPGLILLPFLAFRPSARWLRAIFRRVICEDSINMDTDVTQWNPYLLRWEEDKVTFEINGHNIYSTVVSPIGPLGLIIWIDNQFAAFPSTGKIKAGTLENQSPAWLEIEGINISST